MGEKDLYLDAGVRGYIVNYAREQYWKVKSWMELDDLIQEGYLCYAKCRARFRSPSGGAVPTEEDQRTFQGFLEAAFRNRVTDLQKDPRSRRAEVIEADLPSAEDSPLEAWAASAGDLGDTGVAALIARAPAEITELIKQILIDGKVDVPYRKSRLRQKVLPSGATPRIVKGRRLMRETTSEHYERCLGKGALMQLRAYILGHDLMDSLVDALFK